MAEIFPQNPPPGIPRSEMKVFAALRDGLPADFVVFHGQRINTTRSDRNHQRPEEQEIDFIIFHPNRGYLVLEVKGGGILHDENGWRSVGKNAEVFPIKDPGKQVQGQCRAVDRFLRGHCAYRERAPFFGWAVCFPDVHVGEIRTPELPRERIVDARDLEAGNVEAAISGIFDAVGAVERATRLDPETFKKTIAPKLNLVPRLSDRLGEEATELVRLTEEQYRILEFMGSNKWVAIRGGAGTGKTMIALERARRLSEAGDDVLLLCYNEPLANYLKQQIDGVRVASFHELCKELAHAANLEFQVPGDNERSRIFWEQGAQYLLDEALKRLPEARWDHVIVDEGQDFMLGWWSTVFDLRRGEDSSVWVMYDPNQKVYGTEDLSGELDAVVGELRTNCRNTRRIAARLSELVPNCATTRPEAPEGEEVVRASAPNTEGMLEVIRKTLHNLLNEGQINPERTVILSPRLPETSDVWRQRVFGNWSLRRHEDAPAPNTVRFSSLHRFKGLEADAVILCEVKPTAPGCSPLHLYVASSRARHILHELAYGDNEPPVD